MEQTPANPTTDHGGHAYLRVELDGRPLLGGTLGDLTALSRSANGELLPFTYRDPLDPEQPDAPRPLRRARLVIQELGETPPAPVIGWSQGIGMDIHKTRGGDALCGGETTTVGDSESAMDLIANHGYRLCIPCSMRADGY